MSFPSDFGLYELSDYIFAFDMLPKVKAEKEEVIQGMYDDISPTMVSTDYDLGRMFSLSTPVEKMAIMIISEKDKYDKMLKKYERKAEMFEQAMESLSPRERDVIQVKYFGRKNDLGLSDTYFLETVREAETKLCNFINLDQLEKKKEWNETLKEARKQQVKEWKQSRSKEFLRVSL
ncbi:hypothetical protein [Metabacillus fastidiosus]|uniref:hypothetical protein n=1 Tax=Metabacillus fastidiosus TaxID=1458 RepID=UPI002E207396|nr:hypothetical protein [Metabacillus fastidiosus]